MSAVENNRQEAIEALERFVVENDDLLQLELRSGRFNIFDALGIARAEIRHSNFLAWLLDPAESHGLGALFLNGLLMDVLKRARQQGISVPVSPIDLDGEDLRGLDVYRERWNIDLLVVCDEPKFVVAIENKIDSSEHSDQLNRYENTIAKEFPGHKAMFVYLTTDGCAASDQDWVCYSYGDIQRVLERVYKSNTGAIGNDVAAFLDHYLRLIKERFMNDEELGSV